MGLSITSRITQAFALATTLNACALDPAPSPVPVRQETVTGSPDSTGCIRTTLSFPPQSITKSTVFAAVCPENLPRIENPNCHILGEQGIDVGPITRSGIAVTPATRLSGYAEVILPGSALSADHPTLSLGSYACAVTNQSPGRYMPSVWAGAALGVMCCPPATR